MKNVIILLFCFVSGIVFSQQLKNKTVNVSCGLCKFGKNDLKDCTLTAKIKGKVYVIEGTGINDHGDAHGNDGFCNAVRKAKITGEIKNEKLYVTRFNLLPLKKK